MVSQFNDQHTQQYKDEKAIRWELEKTNTQDLVTKIVIFFNNEYQTIFDKTNIRALDKAWFKQYSPKKYNWVRECPGFVAKIAMEPKLYLHLEMKVKQQGEFEKPSKVAKQGWEVIFHAMDVQVSI